MTATERWTGLALRRAAALGLAAGLGEAALRLGRRYIFGHAQIYSGLDIIWMAPLADLVAFLIVASVLVAALRFVGRKLSPTAKLAIVTGALSALAVWSMGERVPPLGRNAAAFFGFCVGVFIAQGSRLRGVARSWIDRAAVPLGAFVVICGIAQMAGLTWRERRALAALPTSDDDMPNVLLLILDTVRAQSTSLDGYGRPTTPRLAALADSGVHFANAYATAPWTLPSHASMFTGRYPHELSADWLTPLDTAHATLAERLSAAGYRTGGFVGNYMVSREPGIGRGFVHYDDFQRNVEQLAMSSALTSWLGHWGRLRRVIGWYDNVNRRKVDEVNAGLLRWIREGGGRPYFAFVNYFDAHEVYLPPAPFNTMYGPDTARKNWHVLFSMPNGGSGYRADKEQMRPHEVRAELDAYEAALTHLDSRVGAMLDTLAAAGALENTIVVVTSDHGEHFGEHGEFDHGMSLYPQLLHVPLVIYAPGHVPSGVDVRELVTLRDLAATIEQLALGKSTLPGFSLAAYWDSDSTTRSNSPILASRTIADRKVVPDDVRHGAWAAVVDQKLIIEFVGGTDFDTEVYDLTADPLGLEEVPIGPDVQEAVDSATRLYRGMRWRSREVQRERELRGIFPFE